MEDNLKFYCLLYLERMELFFFEFKFLDDVFFFNRFMILGDYR